MQRNHQLDAAKLCLVFLVLWGHAMHNNLGIPVFDVLYRWLYLFHMPTFVFLSGMVSRDVIDTRRARVLVLSILLPFLLHQTVQTWLYAYLADKTWSVALGHPIWALWYLLSLLCWRLALPLVAVFRWPLAIAVAISLLAGLDPDVGSMWSLSRTFALFPFFVAGYLWAKRPAGVVLPMIDWRLAILGLLLLLGVAFASQGHNVFWLYWLSSYSALGADPATGFLYRTGLLLLGSIGLVCVLSLVAACQRVEWVCAMGRASIAPYLLHMYVFAVVEHFGMVAWLQTIPVWSALAVVVLGSVGFTLVFAQIGRAFPWLCDFSWLERNAAAGRIFRTDAAKAQD